MYPSKDPEYRRAYHRRFYSQNPDRLAAKHAKNKEWRENNRERRASQRRERYQTDPEFRARCLAAAGKHARANRQAERNRRLKREYGITEEQYRELYHLQGGRCAICGTKKSRLDVDHHHKSQLVRGLLCNNCNRGVGHLKESPYILKRALLYLRGQ